MPLTLDEIMEHEERLRREIVERECLLAAFKVLHGYAANNQSPKSMELSSLAWAFAPPPITLPLEEPTAPPPAPAALPQPPPEPRYVHPELAAIGNHFGSKGEHVRWAIQRLTHDYTLNDIYDLLKREGGGMYPAEISVVLTRLRNRGQIEEVTRGAGRTPAVYRKPASATPVETESPTLPDETDSISQMPAASDGEHVSHQAAAV